MSDVKILDTKNTTINAQIDKPQDPAELNESPMPLTWAFKLEGKGRINFPSLKQVVKRLLQALIQ
jgi:hypothetical protein